MLNLDIDGPIARVTLNRPEKLNALGPWFWDESVAIFREIDARNEVRVAIISATGDHFSVGLDFVEMMPKIPLPSGQPDGQRHAQIHQLIRDLQSSFTCMERCRVPVIAAIDGYCLGGGIDLITACDLRLSTASATFGVRETKMAIVPDVGTLQRLPRLIHPGIMRELVYTGRDFDAQYAQNIGLVNSVYPDAESLAEAATRLAMDIADNAPLAVQGAKRVINEAERAEVDRGLEYVATWNASYLVTEDLMTAVDGFMKKTKPTFRGR